MEKPKWQNVSLTSDKLKKADVARRKAEADFREAVIDAGHKSGALSKGETFAFSNRYGRLAVAVVAESEADNSADNLSL